MTLRRYWLSFLLCLAFVSAGPLKAASPVWKVTNAKGGTLYLGGSIHALRKSDHPLPAAFDRAFEKSDRIVFEDEQEKGITEAILKAGQYPRGDSLKNHVDPRTYAYVIKLFGLLGAPETKVSRYRPWLLTLMLSAPGLQGLSHDFGVEGHFLKRARAAKKPVSGLVSAREHMSVFTGLSDRQSEGVLLLTFIPNKGGGSYRGMVSGWRQGDAERGWRESRAAFADYPAFGERLLEARNRRWMPKIEGFLQSGQTHFVIVGMAHMGGPEGLPKLLRARGYKVEQL